MKGGLVCVLLGIFFLSLISAAVETRDDALQQIEIAKSEIALMTEAGFPIDYVSDELAEAENLIKQLDYVTVLRDSGSSAPKKAEASSALRLINYNSLEYSTVETYVDNIKNARVEAFRLADEILIFELKIDALKKEGLNVSLTDDLLVSIYDAFDSERYTEASDLLISGEVLIEEIRIENSQTSLLVNSARTFFRRYVVWIIVILLTSLLIVILIRKRLSKRSLQKRLKKLNNELKSLDSLVRKAQEDRFKKASISGLVYNIRSENYKGRIENAKSEISVLQKRLESFNRKATRPKAVEDKSPKRKKVVKKEAEKISKVKHEEIKAINKVAKKHKALKEKIVKDAPKKVLVKKKAAKKVNKKSADKRLVKKK